MSFWKYGNVHALAEEYILFRKHVVFFKGKVVKKIPGHSVGLVLSPFTCCNFLHALQVGSVDISNVTVEFTDNLGNRGDMILRNVWSLMECTEDQWRESHSLFVSKRNPLGNRGITLFLVAKCICVIFCPLEILWEMMWSFFKKSFLGLVFPEKKLDRIITILLQNSIFPTRRLPGKSKRDAKLCRTVTILAQSRIPLAQDSLGWV